MVYVFFVQPGEMMTFDKNVSIMQSVEHLKKHIVDQCNIPLDQQVLLVSGGEPLDPDRNLCSYMAGTDTNPIYLFSTDFDTKRLDEIRNSHLNFDDQELKQKLVECYNLPASLSTVVTRAQVAQEYCDVAKSQLEFCENMVHEQHLQQQAWSAVIANLEDIIVEFQNRWGLFLKNYNDFLSEKESYEIILNHFSEDKELLKRIPVIETLLEAGQKCPNIEGSGGASDPAASQETSVTNLFDWISNSSGGKDRLDHMHESCLSNLRLFEKELYPKLEADVKQTISSAEAPERKEIEGLGKRLFLLDEVLRKMSKTVASQCDMAQSFQQNQNRVSDLKDISILPDLCATHYQQLEYIEKFHKNLMNDREKIVKAKSELSKSLCTRIEWVQRIESVVAHLDGAMVYFNEHLNRLRSHLGMFQQLHLAPVTYMNAVVEVVRRRAFSQLFYLWASDLACQQMTIHNDEVTRRKEFSSQFEGHFLNALFPGMEDRPPAFATEAPPMFDAKLPRITEEDVDRLKKDLPDFAERLLLPDMNQVVNFYMAKSAQKDKDKVDDAKAVEEKLIQAVSDVGLASNLDKNLLKATGSEPCLLAAHGLPNLKDCDKGCESETDTEEFEKVGQSPLELAFPPGAQPPVCKVTDKQDASTLTETRPQIYPPKKPPRSFLRSANSFEDPFQRTSSSSTNESLSNVKNISLDSIDELSSTKCFTGTADSCFNAGVSNSTKNCQVVLKSASPQSPARCQHSQDFSNEEFYLDESLPSSGGTGNSQGSELVRQLDTANIVVALLQDNLHISRSEHEKIKSFLVDMSVLAKRTTLDLKTELNDLKTFFLNGQQALSRQYEDLGSSWEDLVLEIDRNERQLVETMKKEQELETDRFRYNLMEKEEMVRSLEQNKRAIENRLTETCRDLGALEEKLTKLNEDSTSRIEDLLRQLHEKDADKERSLKELTETLKKEHKLEIDNIKSRFKLMTMERSPSCSSLEKEKDFGSLPSPTVFLQMTQNFEMDKENAVLEERMRWEKILEDKIKELEYRFEEEKTLLMQDVAKRVSHDKDKQIDVLREREKNLNLECIKHKTTIQQLAECEEERRDSEFGLLTREKDCLREELDRVKAEMEAMTASVALFEGSRMDAVTSPREMSKSEISRPHRLSIDSCREGDVVLLLWDATHLNFKILQESDAFYFLHPDCHESLGLQVVDGRPNHPHLTVEVVDREYCKTKRSENRYKLPKGARFWRVKVRPIKTLDSKDQSQSAYQPRPSSGHAPLLMSQSSVTTATFEESQWQPFEAQGGRVQEMRGESVEKHFAEDSGIVENVEEAAAALEEVDARENDWSERENHRKSVKLNWLDSMFRSMFGKSQ